MYTINFPAIASSAAHNFSVKTIEFKMAAVSVKRSIVREWGRQTMSFAYILFFAAGVDDRCCLTGGCGATAELRTADGKGNVRV